MGKPRLVVKDFGFKKLIAAANELAQAPAMKVGMLAKSNSREDDSGLTNAELAIILHFGTRTIPGRPFLSNAIHAHGREWNRALMNVITAVLKGKLTTEEGLERVAKKVIADIRKSMRDVGVPDAPVTLEEKAGSTPLVDSRQLINSVTSEFVHAH